MAGQISYTVNESAVATGGNPISASRLLVGSVLQTINENLAAGGAVVPQANAWTAPGNVTGNLVALFFLSTQPMTMQTNGAGTIGVQTITIGGTPTGGTFTLGYQGQVTVPIAYNASAANVQTALVALSTIGAGNVVCTGGSLPGTAVTCTFQPALTGATIPLLTSNIAGLTGGSPTITIANASGTPQDVIQLAANIDLSWDVNCGKPCPFLGAVTELYLTNTNACNFRGMILTY
jgi:hypothetical protein